MHKDQKYTIIFDEIKRGHSHAPQELCVILQGTENTYQTSMDLRRYYEILELEPGVSPENVTQAYKDLVNVWHPDRFSKVPRLKKKAEEKLKEVNEAYEKLQSYLTEQGPLKSESKAQMDAFGGAVAHSISNQTTKKISRNLARTYPLARFFARFTDYLLFGFLLGSLNIYDKLLRLDIHVLLFPVILTLAWVFIEAALLSFFGTSPGKWLLKTTIIDSSLEKPGYFVSLRRSLSVWCNGMGTGIFFIAPVTMGISYKRLKKDGYAPWDREGRFYLIHGKVGAPRFLFAFLFFAIFSGLNTYKLHERMALVSKAMQETESPVEREAKREETISKEQNTATLKDKLKASSDLADAQYRLGKACYELGRYKEAIEALKQVVRIQPDFAEAQYGLGVSYANMHLYEEASSSLVQAIKLKPGYAEAHHILGFVYLNIGDRKAAVEQLKILKGLDKDLANELRAYLDISIR